MLQPHHWEDHSSAQRMHEKKNTTINPFNCVIIDSLHLSGGTQSIPVKSCKRKNRKIYARVHDLFRIKRGYHKKENIEEDSGTLTTYSTNGEEG